MKYGQIAESKKINYAIYRCFEHLCREDQQRFVKKFREQPHDSDQIMHTFRELILGAYLSSCGFKVRHEYSVENKTPDWCILDDKSTVIGIIELVNFHIDAVTENEIDKQIDAKGTAVYWRDANKDNVSRLYDCIRNKARKYKSLLDKLGVPYIIAVFPEFQIVIDFKEELCPCLFDENTGLFKEYPEISGVLYFEEIGGKYFFYYAVNPKASRVLPIGVFSLVLE